MDDALDAHFGDRLRVTHRNVDDAAAWRDAFGTEIPVLTTPDGHELCRHALDVAAVRQWLAGQANTVSTPQPAS